MAWRRRSRQGRPWRTPPSLRLESTPTTPPWQVTIVFISGSLNFYTYLRYCVIWQFLFIKSNSLFLRNHPFQQGQNEHSEFQFLNLWCIFYPVRERSTDLFVLDDSLTSYISKRHLLPGKNRREGCTPLRWGHRSGEGWKLRCRYCLVLCFCFVLFRFCFAVLEIEMRVRQWWAFSWHF